MAVIGMVAARAAVEGDDAALATAAWSAPNVQLAAVPVPTTVVGWDVSAGLPLDGTPVLHEPFGFPP